MVKKEVDKGIKYKGKSHKVRQLVKKLNLNSDIQISRRKTWFSDAMDNLDKKDK